MDIRVGLASPGAEGRPNPGASRGERKALPETIGAHNRTSEELGEKNAACVVLLCRAAGAFP